MAWDGHSQGLQINTFATLFNYGRLCVRPSMFLNIVEMRVRERFLRTLI